MRRKDEEEELCGATAAPARASDVDLTAPAAARPPSNLRIIISIIGRRRTIRLSLERFAPVISAVPWRRMREDEQHNNIGVMPREKTATGVV